MEFSISDKIQDGQSIGQHGTDTGHVYEKR